MFVDMSAVVAILANEPDAVSFAHRLEAARQRLSAGHVILEASMRLSTLLGLEPTVAGQLVTRLLREAGIAVVPITEISHLAVAGFERYGRNRQARLNFWRLPHLHLREGTRCADPVQGRRLCAHWRGEGIKRSELEVLTG